jgi:predicted Zn-dependent peptidase
MTAISIRFPVGAAQDPRGEEGTANLLGALIQERGNASLVASGGEVLVEVGAEEILITLLSPPDRWVEGVTLVESLLYGGGLANADLEPVRGSIVDILRFEAGSPVRNFENLRSALVRGEGTPASRPPMGSLGTISLIARGTLDTFRLTHLRREAGVVAITGPVALAEAEAVFRTPVRVLTQEGATNLPPLTIPPPAEALPSGAPVDPDTLAPEPLPAARVAVVI